MRTLNNLTSFFGKDLLIYGSYARARMLGISQDMVNDIDLYIDCKAELVVEFLELLGVRDITPISYWAQCRCFLKVKFNWEGKSWDITMPRFRSGVNVDSMIELLETSPSLDNGFFYRDGHCNMNRRQLADSLWKPNPNYNNKWFTHLDDLNFCNIKSRIPPSGLDRTCREGRREVRICKGPLPESKRDNPWFISQLEEDNYDHSFYRKKIDQHKTLMGHA